MKIIAIKDIIRKDVPIYYRKLYSGLAVVEIVNSCESFRIDFTVEYKPTGQKDISISFVDKIDYPIVPIVKELKLYIDAQEAAGGLPD